MITDAAAPPIPPINFKIEIVPTDGTKAANLRKRGLRYVTVFGQPSRQAALLGCARTLHCFRSDVECLNRVNRDRVECLPAIARCPLRPKSDRPSLKCDPSQWAKGRHRRGVSLRLYL